MPFPFLIAAIVATATAATGYIAKKIYDDSNCKSSNYDKTYDIVYGPSKEELKHKQRTAIYEQLKRELCALWQHTDDLLCLYASAAVQHCDELSECVRLGKLTPLQALREVNSREVNKSQVLKEKLEMPAPQNFFNGILIDTASLIRRINVNLDDAFAPRMALRDNYELCRDEYRGELLRTAFNSHQEEGNLVPLPDDCVSDYTDLAALWHKARLLEDAHADGSELRVVACGLLKAGKSSLLNSLFDDREDTLFKVGITHVTTKNQIQVKDGIRFIDTPGLEANQEDTLEARKAYQSADLLLFVHNGEHELVKQELDLLHSLMKETGNQENRLVMVLSHIDLAGDDLARLADKVRVQVETAVGIDIPIHCISNKRYKKSFEPGKEALRNKSGIDELRQYIYSRKDADMKSLTAEREAKLSRTYAEIDEWITAFSRDVNERRLCLTKEQNEIFTIFNANVLASIRSQLQELR